MKKAICAYDKHIEVPSVTRAEISVMQLNIPPVYSGDFGTTPADSVRV